MTIRLRVCAFVTPNQLYTVRIAIADVDGQGMGASLVVDSFTESAFMLETGGLSGDASAITSPLGETRSAGITTRFLAPGTILSSTLDTGMDESLTFTVNGTSTSQSMPLDLRASYFGGGARSILGFSDFELDFSSLSGQGNLIVELGSQSIPDGNTNRIALGSPGLLSIPFNQLNFGTNGSLGSFLALHFTFEAVSDNFTFELDEIRLVPEPSSAVLLGLGVAPLLLRRRRG